MGGVDLNVFQLQYRINDLL